MTMDELTTVEQVTTEVGEWIDESWDPNLTVAKWWQQLADAGLSNPMLPVAAGGLGWSRTLAQASLTAMAVREVLGPPAGLAMMLAAPTIAAYGDPEQISRFVPPILNGQHVWCQLFSEPEAGSDLASLRCKAQRDGNEWVVDGQKVWTSGGHVADYGMLIARTDPHAPKHAGITYFGLPMFQPGVDVRPLREMTGRSIFNEVFLSGARVNDANRIGEMNGGWRVANATLNFERASLGSGSVRIARAFPGARSGQLERPAGDFAKNSSGEGEGLPPVGPQLFAELLEIVRRRNPPSGPVLRDDMTRLFIEVEVNRMSGLRARAGGSTTGAEGNLAKLSMSHLFRRFRDVGNDVIGADGMLDAAGSSTGGWVQEVTLFSPAPSILGGTDQVQRNIVSERTLGLPRDLGPAKDTPFDTLAKS